MLYISNLCDIGLAEEGVEEIEYTGTVYSAETCLVSSIPASVWRLDIPLNQDIPELLRENPNLQVVGVDADRYNVDLLLRNYTRETLSIWSCNPDTVSRLRALSSKYGVNLVVHTLTTR